MTEDSNSINFETFTNDSAMMIAYERFLESKREKDALFLDPFAEKMASTKGESLSDAFGQYKNHFGFDDWPEFHKHGHQCRLSSLMIDHIVNNGSSFCQIASIGA